jgi:hypothetical protein
VVGELWKHETGAFAFGYRHDLEAARAAGFRHLPEFPQPRTVADPYVSSYLFSTFAQRVPAPHRSDRRAMLERWGVVDADDVLEILARSGGILATDRIELAEYRSEADDLSMPLEMRIAGSRFNAPAAVHEGDHLRLRRESGNGFDPSATIVLTRLDQKLGYVPKQYSALVSRLLDAETPLEAVAVRHLPAPPEEARWVMRLSRRK